MNGWRHFLIEVRASWFTWFSKMYAGFDHFTRFSRGRLWFVQSRTRSALGIHWQRSVLQVYSLRSKHSRTKSFSAFGPRVNWSESKTQRSRNFALALIYARPQFTRGQNAEKLFLQERLPRRLSSWCMDRAVGEVDKLAKKKYTTNIPQLRT